VTSEPVSPLISYLVLPPLVDPETTIRRAPDTLPSVLNWLLEFSAHTDTYRSSPRDIFDCARHTQEEVVASP